MTQAILGPNEDSRSLEEIYAAIEMLQQLGGIENWIEQRAHAEKLETEKKDNDFEATRSQGNQTNSPQQAQATSLRSQLEVRTRSIQIKFAHNSILGLRARKAMCPGTPRPTDTCNVKFGLNL